MKSELFFVLCLLAFSQAVLEREDCQLCRRIGSNLCNEGDSSSLCNKIANVPCPSELLRGNRIAKKPKPSIRINIRSSDESIDGDEQLGGRKASNKNLMDLVSNILSVAHTHSKNDLRRIRAKAWWRT